MPATIQHPIFSDELVRATELNRQSGSILDKAAERPITITRNDQYFVLQRREEAACQVNRAVYSEIVFELLNTAFSLIAGGDISSGHPYGWITVFDSDDLKLLVQEVVEAYRAVASNKENWDYLDTLIHEWHESAIAINSPELKEAWNSDYDEVPLTSPFTETSCS